MRIIANSVVINHSVKRFGWRLRYGEESFIGFLLIPTVKGRCLTVKPVIKGLKVHTTVCFEDNTISGHLTIESSKNIHKQTKRIDLNTLMATFREDAERFRSRWLERCDLNEKVFVPTNEFINSFWVLMREFIKHRGRELYIDSDVRRLEGVAEVLGLDRVLTLESLLEAMRRIPSWMSTYWRTFYSPEQKLVILVNSGEVYEAYAVKPKLIELLRSINGEKLHPEDFFKILGKIFGKSIEMYVDVFGFKELFTELWERGLL